MLLFDKEVSQQQCFPKGTIMEGTLQYAKEKTDDRGITVTVSWEGPGKNGSVKASVTRSMA